MKRSFGIRLAVASGALVVLVSSLMLVVRAEKRKQATSDPVPIAVPAVSLPSTESKVATPRPARSTRSS